MRGNRAVQDAAASLDATPLTLSRPAQKAEIHSWVRRRGMRLANMAAVLGVLAIWRTCGSMVRMSKIGLHDGVAGWALLFALQALILFLTILAHECGHLLAGWFVGFRVQEITLGPFQIRRAGRGGLAFTFNNCLPWFGGGAMIIPSRPMDAAELRWRAALVAAGGPFASCFLAASAAVPLIGYATRQGSVGRPIDFWMIFVLFLTLIWSLAAFLGNAVPISIGGRHSDGAVMLELLRGGSWAERFCALNTLAGASVAGERPRDWRGALIQTHLSTPSDRSVPDLNLSLMAYYWLLDRQDVAGAGVVLDRTLGAVAATSPLMRTRLILEAAYWEARHFHNASAARTWLNRAKGATADRHAHLRAESAVLLAEGRCEEAWARAQEGLFALERAVSTGILQAEAEWLREIAHLAQGRRDGESC